MNFLKIFIILHLILFKNLTICAQTLEWSNTTKIRGNSIFTTIIGEDENGIYILRHRNKLLSKFIVLERYRHNLGLETSKSFLMKNTRIIFSDVNKNGLLIVKQIYSKKGRYYNIVATYLNPVFEPKISDQLLMKIVVPEKISEPKIIIKFDETHSNYLLANVTNVSSKNKNIEYSIFDLNFEQKALKTFQIDKNYKFDKIEDLVFDNKNCVTFLASQNAVGNPVPVYFLLENSELKTKTMLLADSNYQIDQVKILYNNSNNSKIVTGFYTSSYKSGFEGQFLVKFRDIVNDSIFLNKTPFSKVILKETEGETKSQYGFIPSTYKTKKIVKCTNGGIIKIIENTIINKDQEIMVINGQQISQGKYVYIFENLIIQNFDSLGNLVWESNINKIQSSANDGGILSSVFVSNTQNKVNILFNDPITNGGDIMLADFTPSGTKEIRKIADGDLFNALIISDEGKQISNNKIIVPVIKERKFALLKIQF